MNIGLIPMSAKPYHAGHHKLIQRAVSQNDKTFVFVSLSGRGVRKIKDPTDKRTIKAGARKIETPKKGEVPIFGDDMKFIWENVLLESVLRDPQMAGKITVYLIRSDVKLSPINLVHESCERLRDAINDKSIPFQIRGSSQVFNVLGTCLSIYSDDKDIVNNYSDKTMIPLYGELLDKRIHRIGVSRKDTVDVSGTEMRRLISLGDETQFKNLLPPLSENSKNIITKILFESARSGKSFMSRSRESRVSNNYAPPGLFLG